jgi:ribonuclease HIII
VVAACLFSDEEIPELTALGVRDSKKIAAKKLLSIDEVLRSRYVHALVVVLPEDYNARYEEIRNLNKLLAGCHAEAITGCLSQAPADFAVSDKFGKNERLDTAMRNVECNLPLKQIVRGEAIPQVAAASILARAEFVRQMAKLSEEIGVELPKGAAPMVDKAGRKVVALHGVKALNRVAKVHFKNYQRSLKPDLFG